MLSSTGISPQIGGFLSEAVVALSNIKKSTSARWSTYAQRRKQHIPKQQPEINLASTQVTDITEPCTSLLEELGLCHLPKDWKEHIVTPLSVCPRQHDGENKWFVSHTSSGSFFQNKHGFSNHLLSSKKPARLKSSLFTLFGNQPQLLTTLNLQIRPLHSASEKRIQQLEERANSETHSPRAQADYLRAIVTEDPLYVIRRYESGQYAGDESVRREYIKALVLADRISQAELDQMSAHPSSGHTVQGASNASSFGTATLSGSEEHPVHVVMQSQKGAFFKEQLWNTIRFLIGLFLILSVIEAQLQMKMSTNQKEILPDAVDRRCRFSDVQGVDEAKQELQEVVEFLRNPDKFRRLGGKMPQGVLLIGAPGTGKTMLAKAVAGEAGVPFFFCSGSEFDEMFVGVGAARVRNLFVAAREHAPCIVFIDELDAIGGTRVVHDHQPYSRMTLNQLLVELDGFDKTEGIVVIGATNFPEILDKALVRPGRFDTKITVPMPDVKARHDILKVHIKNVQMAEDVNVEVLARGTSGFSGADLANLVNQAAIRAATDGDCSVTTKHLEFAKDKILMGPERKSAVIEAENRKLIAYHEGGHAIVAIFTPGASPIHKATIMPRGQALGMVAQLPEKDELNWSKKQLLAKLDVCMAGRVAEELIFGKENVTTGAASDAEQATKIAKAMVTSYGMSEKVGMIQVNDNDNLSPDTRSLMENEVKLLLKDAYDRAKSLLQSRSKEHKNLAEALLRYETLDADEIKLVIQGKPLPRPL